MGKIEIMKISNLIISFCFISISAMGILSSPVMEDDGFKYFINQNKYAENNA